MAREHSLHAKRPAKVLILDPLHSKIVSRLSSAHEVRYLPSLLPRDLEELGDWPEVLIVRSGHRITGALLDRASSLRLVIRAGSGSDNIDLQRAADLGLTVCNVPDASTVTVAEYTLALLLAAARRVPEALAGARKEDLLGVEMRGKTLGILGYGAIGRAVGELGTGLGMRVLAVVRTPCPERARDAARRGVELVSLEEAFSVSDAVTIHVPLGPDTQRMVAEEQLSQLRGGIVVNVARSGVLCHHSLLRELQRGRVVAAASDVVEAQDAPSDLLSHPRFIWTPHIGAMTDDAQLRVAAAAEDALSAFLAGDRPRYVLTAPEAPGVQ